MFCSFFQLFLLEKQEKREANLFATQQAEDKVLSFSALSFYPLK